MKRWKLIKTNLWRNQDSGIYFARVKVLGRDIWRTLDTDVRTTADLRLGGELAKIRCGSGRQNSGKLTMGECAAIYLERKRVHGHPRRGALKPRSLSYRQETYDQWVRNVPGFAEARVAGVTEAMCKGWVDRARAKYGPTRFNGMLETLHGCFAVAVEQGALEKSPAAGILRAPPSRKEKEIPSRESFGDILLELDRNPRRKWSRLSLRAYAFTGIRPDEGRHVEPRDFNKAEGTLTVRTTKNGKTRVLQLIPQALELFLEHPVDIWKALKKNPRRSLETICVDLKLPHMTPYSFRHMFLTRLLESGVDIMTAAHTAGHQDKGRTLLGTYAHLRTPHLRSQMAKVTI